MGKPSAKLLAQLLKNKEYRRKIVESGGFNPVQLKIRQWQTQRLAKTYEDFAKMKRYKKATEFFETDLYGAEDFSQRDADVERVYPIMEKMLSDQAVESITLAIDLHVLTQELDAKLESEVSKRIGNEDALTAQIYGDSYRACDNRKQRIQQIECLISIGKVLDEVVTNPVLYATIKVVRIPARLAGFGSLQDFVETGFSAFRKMKGAQEFLQAIYDREIEIMETLFDGRALPEWAAP